MSRAASRQHGAATLGWLALLLGAVGCPEPRGGTGDSELILTRPVSIVLEPVDLRPLDRDADGTADALDCAADDAARDHEEPLYVDRDGDGLTVGTAQRVCVGDDLSGFASVRGSHEDCDDANAAVWQAITAYVDGDGDQRGGSELVSLCVGDSHPDGYAAESGDCADDDPERYFLLHYAYRDADGDGHTVQDEGVLCAADRLPAGYLAWPHGEDCDDGDPARYLAEDLYSDVDGDGVGDAMAWPVCHGASLEGWSRSGGDCAPDDAQAWQEFGGVYRDGDRDGVTAGPSLALCAGATLPVGFSATPQGEDCDDADPVASVSLTVYPDADLDGAGAGPGRTLCNDGSVPAGEVARAGDCAPADGARWQVLRAHHIDHDGDGRTTPRETDVCSGQSLSAPYFASAVGNDCNDGDATLTAWQVTYPDEDADGIGAWPYAVQCLGAELPEGYSRYGDDEDDADPAVGTSEDTTIVALW